MSGKDKVVKFSLMNSEELKLEDDLRLEPQNILLDYMSDDADFDNRADYQGSGSGTQDMTSQEQDWRTIDVDYKASNSRYEDTVHRVIPRKLETDPAESNQMKPWADIGLGRGQDGDVVLGEEEVVQFTYHPITETQTTPHDGVTDDIIVPAGSGEGGIRCPEDDEDDCAQEEFSDNIISTTVKFTYKPTTKPPPKSTDTGPCYSKDLLNCDNQVESTNLMKPDRNSSKSGQLNIEGSKPSTEYNPQRPANSSREQEVTQTPNLALIIGIVGGVLVALIILIIALYKFRSRDEGTYKVDESQNFAFLEKKQQQGNGALLGNHSGGGGKSGKKKDVKEWYV